VKLTAHFTLEEMTFSATGHARGLDNSISAKENPALYANVKSTAEHMEEVRALLGAPVTVISCYRSFLVNKAVGGVANSDHLRALAVDFRNKKYSIQETFEIIRNSGLKYDQLIDEFNSWIHIGFGPAMRGEILVARKVDKKTIYRKV